MKKILVTGGCGYIGSHTIVDLIQNGYSVISIDNLSNSEESVLDGVEAITGVRVKNYVVDLCDSAATDAVFANHPDIEGVIHFAALKNVGDSVDEPLLYFHNNMESLVNVLKMLKKYAIHSLIFSSSCSVYGNAEELPVTENTPMLEAESPYARTKQMGEKLITDISKVESQLNALLLRYFNPAGAHPSGKLGESPRNKANNLVPIITETAMGIRDSFTVFGTDYPTRDGSCVRDYIHVMDLARAHTLSLKYVLEKTEKSTAEVFNVGIGNGVSVLEAIQAFEKVNGQKLNYELGGRRAGDVVSIYANHDKATELLGWQPQYTIDDIMRTAWQWEKIRRAQA